MMMTADRGVIDKDLGWKKTKRNLSKFKNTNATIGMHEGENYGDEGLTAAQLGAIHEFGSGTTSSRSGGTVFQVPPRPFLRNTFDEQQKDYMKKLMAALDGPFDKEIRLDKVLMLLAEMFRGDVLDTIKNSPGAGGGGKLLPWAPATLEWKKEQGKEGDPVLFDTGQLRGAIKVKVNK
jgi:phage gpG-like protein